jgi:hypothetical protein
LGEAKRFTQAHAPLAVEPNRGQARVGCRGPLGAALAAVTAGHEECAWAQPRPSQDRRTCWPLSTASRKPSERFTRGCRGMRHVRAVKQATQASTQQGQEGPLAPPPVVAPCKAPGVRLLLTNGASRSGAPRLRPAFNERAGAHHARTRARARIHGAIAARHARGPSHAAGVRGAAALEAAEELGTRGLVHAPVGALAAL